MLLLDTHAYIWLASDQRQLSRRGLAAIAEAGGQLYVSAISALESALLVKRGRLELPCPAAEFYRLALKQHGIHEISVDHRVAFASAALPDLHNDPFDRIIVATAAIHHLRVLTKDRIIPGYPDVEAVW